MTFNQTDQVSQLLNRRFALKDENGQSLRMSLDMHMDLLMAFHEPHAFDKIAFSFYPLEDILEYLKATHRYYLSDLLKRIRFSIDELSKSKNDLSELQSALFQFFNYFENDLIEHVREEEKDLFPYIQQLIAAKSGQTPNQSTKEKMELDDFLHHHDSQAEDLLERLVNFLNEKIKQFPDNMSLSILLTRLQFFMRDLQVHSKIEEEVLIPKAIDLEIEVSDRLN
jgi:regulator of cell morphogenesis and NO signaling